jgi:hypothetical protein
MVLYDGSPSDKNSKAFMIDVRGLPEGQEIEISEHRREWRVRHRWGQWSEQRFGSPEDALASLSV